MQSPSHLGHTGRVCKERNGPSQTPEMGEFRRGMRCKKFIKHVNTHLLKCFTAVLGILAFLFYTYDSSHAIKRVRLLL